MPSYYTLGSIGRDKARSRPLYSITEDQKHAAEEFLRVSCSDEALIFKCIRSPGARQ